MQVWDGISNSRITFDSPYSDATDEIQPMATLVENMHLQRGILASLRQRGVVEIIDGSRVLKVKEGEGCWPVVELEGGRSLRARLLVNSPLEHRRVLYSFDVQIGADGYNSPVKAYSNIESFGWAYDRNGVVASVQVSPSNGGLGMTTAWQRFLPEGPVAFLPVSTFQNLAALY
jgi:ubiquinone biosynthesis monooxygenase Coq6